MRTLIIPACGRGTRFKDAGYAIPKPFITLPTGVPMIVGAIIPFLQAVDQIVVGLDREADPALCARVSEALDAYAESKDGEFRCKSIRFAGLPFQAGGAAYTVLALGMSQCEDAEEVVVANCDQLFDEKFVGTWLTSAYALGAAGSILTFAVPDKTDARWSFVEKDVSGDVVAVVEKQHVSDEATCGAYYFRSWSELRRALISHLDSPNTVNGEHYFAPTYNHLNGHVSAFMVPVEAFTSVGTPALLAELEAAYAAKN